MHREQGRAEAGRFGAGHRLHGKPKGICFDLHPLGTTCRATDTVQRLRSIRITELLNLCIQCAGYTFKDGANGLATWLGARPNSHVLQQRGRIPIVGKSEPT